MHTRPHDRRQNLLSSLWLVSMPLALLAAGLATLTLFVDERVSGLGGLQPWLFGGSVGAARSLLSSIVGSPITVVAIQQAANRFSPRVIRTFIRDKVDQLTFLS